MKIVIDGRMWAWTGIGRVTRNLLAELDKTEDTNQYIVLMLAKDIDKWQPASPRIHKELADYAPYSLSEQIGLARHLLRLKPDLVHFMNFNSPLFYFGRSVVTINDLTLIDFKNIRGTGLAKLIYEVKYWAMRLVFHRAVRRASHIITISQFVKDQLLERYRGLNPSDVTVAYPAVDASIAKPEDISDIVKGPFLLFVGNAYPHKNLARLVEAFDMISEKLRDLSLVLVGPDDYFQQVTRSGTHNKKVIFPGYVSDGQLAGLYKNAALFVFPSLSEGFGMPPLEAMTYGTPVISSDATCMPEVCGDAAEYFDPYDARDIAGKIEALLDNPKRLEELKKLGPEHVRQFSWEKMAKAMLGTYRL